MRAFPLLLSTFLLSNPAGADALDEAILKEMAFRHVPGVSLLVVQDGKVVKEQGYGLANIEHGVPVTPDTVFQSGSIGKQFTAALVLLLARDGKLQLDDPVSRYLDGTPPAWRGITIRHLLNHTSGLDDPYEKMDFRKDYTDEELIAHEASIPLLFSPGEKWSYSNTGYHLLGFICNKVGGKFYGEQLRERIFAPLGMGTRIISEADIVPHRAAGYEWDGERLRNQTWVAPRLNTTADGSLYLTARDLMKWDAALYGNAILDAGMRAASWTPTRLADGSTVPYGYGWALQPRNGHRAISHSGMWQGFTSMFDRYVDDRLTVIVLTNSDVASPERIANLAAAHYVPALALKAAPPVPDADQATAARVRAAAARLAAGKLPERVSAAVAAAYTPALVDIAAELRRAGALRELLPLEPEGSGPQRRLRYLLVYENDQAVLSLRMDRTGTIDSLGFSAQ
nr:serine hydrolase domain-containing protein [uncultured Massilia sp.]